MNISCHLKKILSWMVDVSVLSVMIDKAIPKEHHKELIPRFESTLRDEPDASWADYLTFS